jgi:uncharacterized protein YdhG (YjbR/CyaY superfamily)
MSPKKETNKYATPSGKTPAAWTEEEKAAMIDRPKEMKAEPRANKDKAEGEKALLAKIAGMKGSDRAMAKRIHEIVKASAPDLSPKTWYGMPAYANKDGRVVCFFKPASQYKTRYATFGFEEAANIDEGAMWPTSFALTELTDDDEERLATLVKKAAS